VGMQAAPELQADTARTTTDKCVHHYIQCCFSAWHAGGS
jgi:hypothetical protein